MKAYRAIVGESSTLFMFEHGFKSKDLTNVISFSGCRRSWGLHILGRRGRFNLSLYTSRCQEYSVKVVSRNSIICILSYGSEFVRINTC